MNICIIKTLIMKNLCVFFYNFADIRYMVLHCCFFFGLCLDRQTCKLVDSEIH